MLCLDYSSAPVFMFSSLATFTFVVLLSIESTFALVWCEMGVVEQNKKEEGRKVKVKVPAKRKREGFSNKCASLVKEQRARLYILRRCATMLLCWYIQGDDS
ncbi:hypothetical protein VNO77_18787 [Canavalia gladiata]|uniref:Uncharacterized protein n=1 Tax=Canavalia gladiata TaxID=3824 RepID=A0AAN9LLC5_CANGL